MLFLLSGDFIFKINIFEKFFQEYHESQTDGGPVWVQSVCKGYQQIALVAKDLIYAVSTIFINRGWSILLLEY